MTRKELEALMQAGGSATIEVHAAEGTIYQVFHRFGARLEPVSEKGRGLCYPSRYRALKALAEMGVPKVEFVHKSAYGEMIGLETPFEATELRQVIDLSTL